MTLTVININALLIAYSAFHSPRTSIRLQILALLSVFMYTLLQGLGMILPINIIL